MTLDAAGFWRWQAPGVPSVRLTFATDRHFSPRVIKCLVQLANPNHLSHFISGIEKRAGDRAEPENRSRERGRQPLRHHATVSRARVRRSCSSSRASPAGARSCSRAARPPSC